MIRSARVVRPDNSVVWSVSAVKLRAAAALARRMYHAEPTCLAFHDNDIEESSCMPANGFGVALKTLRERRTLSGRELSTLAGLDHAYENRLEAGEKANPSDEVLDKLVRALKPGERDSQMLRWLAQHPNTDHALVLHVLHDPSVTMDEFTMAAGAVHRGGRPDPVTLIERVRRVMREE